MKVSVVAFATASDVLGQEAVELELAPGATLETLYRNLVERHSELESIWPRLAVAVDGMIVERLDHESHALREGVEVALLPPVSGGAPEAVHLVDGPIDAASLERRVTDPSCGAVILFIGNVRDHHQGRKVERLTYTAYRPMAERCLRQIVRELSSDGAARLAITHRLGEVEVGEASVVIAAASAHRDKAYETSRTALERLKREVPIWKREHYAGGASIWREEEPLEAGDTPDYEELEDLRRHLFEPASEEGALTGA